MNRRSLLAGLAGLSLASVPVLATEAEPIKLLFVQVTSGPGLPALARDPGESPGRAEVTLDGEFVGCLLASYYYQKGELTLLPFSMGLLVHTKPGARNLVEVKFYGELANLSKPVLAITEMKK